MGLDIIALGGSRSGLRGSRSRLLRGLRSRLRRASGGRQRRMRYSSLRFRRRLPGFKGLAIFRIFNIIILRPLQALLATIINIAIKTPTWNTNSMSVSRLLTYPPGTGGILATTIYGSFNRRFRRRRRHRRNRGRKLRFV